MLLPLHLACLLLLVQAAAAAAASKQWSTLTLTVDLMRRHQEALTPAAPGRQGISRQLH
jgi:hypothetical protein